MFQQEQRTSAISRKVMQFAEADFDPSRWRCVMQGQITKFHEDIGFGVISATDGRKYRFAKSDIRNPNGHLLGIDVDFLVESRSPKEIILLHGSPWTVFGRS
ncbi:hypothetical protein [Hyphomicrobium sp.]|uniref:hypothetical protein n=1 Tax=Hyphomicrobium sp. TaxID=82 RepID=UPI003F7019F3